MSDEGDKDRRIAELEQEVARLRAQVEADPDEDSGLDHAEQAWMEGASEEAPPRNPADEAADQRELARHIPSRRRAIVIAVVIGVVALGAIVAIFTGLSGVIQPLSKSAAGALEPFEPTTPAGSTKAPPAKAAPDPMRVPGL